MPAITAEASGMGEVYRTDESHLDRIVAIKRLKDE